MLPVLDDATTLPQQLEALARQTYGGRWELVLCDNGSVDGTRRVGASWQPRLPKLRIVDASHRRGLNHARNVGASSAHGDYIVFCDGDDVVAPGWLEAMADAAPSADIVGGAFDPHKLNSSEVLSWRLAPVYDQLPRKHDFLVGIPGGNCGVWTSVARDVGWDERFTFGGSDIEFSWRAQLAGYSVAYAPNAVIHVRFRESIRETAWQSYQYGASGPRLYRSFRHCGMPRSDFSDATRTCAWLVRHLRDVWGPREAKGRWVRRAAHLAGRLVGAVRERVAFL